MKKHETKKQPISETLRTVSVGLALVLTLGNVVSSAFNYAMASKLTPVATNVNNLTGRVQAVEDKQKELVTRAEMTLMINDIRGDISDLSKTTKTLLDLHLNK